MIKEYPAENRAELTVPQCPSCHRYMVRDNIHGKLGSDNNTRQRGSQTILDPLTMGPNVTLLQMTFRCRKHPFGARVGMEDLVTLNKYPANNIKLVDREGNEL